MSIQDKEPPGWPDWALYTISTILLLHLNADSFNSSMASLCMYSRDSISLYWLPIVLVAMELAIQL